MNHFDSLVVKNQNELENELFQQADAMLAQRMHDRDAQMLLRNQRKQRFVICPVLLYRLIKLL